MTEKEAKKKLCPFSKGKLLFSLMVIATVIDKNKEGARNLEKVNEDSLDKCCGSECMAWKDYGEYSSCGMIRKNK